MELRKYICDYCKIEYIPKRRKVQKFCSNSCRVSSHRSKMFTNQQLSIKGDKAHKKELKAPKMSLTGVGNSLAGTLVAEGLKSLFTNEENKPATKLDIKKLEQKIKRYQEIKNIPINFNNQKPYYDNVLNIVVYL